MPTPRIQKHSRASLDIAFLCSARGPRVLLVTWKAGRLR